MTGRPARTAGTETAGTETAGTETAGTETAGTETAGTETAAPRVAVPARPADACPQFGDRLVPPAAAMRALTWLRAPQCPHCHGHAPAPGAEGTAACAACSVAYPCLVARTFEWEMLLAVAGWRATPGGRSHVRGERPDADPDRVLVELTASLRPAARSARRARAGTAAAAPPAAAPA